MIERNCSKTGGIYPTIFEQLQDFSKNRVIIVDGKQILQYIDNENHFHLRKGHNK
jgi:hypothetical protein